MVGPGAAVGAEVLAGVAAVELVEEEVVVMVDVVVHADITASLGFGVEGWESRLGTCG